MKSKALSAQLLHLLQSISDAEEAISIQDPANPDGNDLMEFLRSNWWALKAAAAQTISQINTSGWEAVFGPVETVEKVAAQVRLATAARSVEQPTRPWCETD